MIYATRGQLWTASGQIYQCASIKQVSESNAVACPEPRVQPNRKYMGYYGAEITEAFYFPSKFLTILCHSK